MSEYYVKLVALPRGKRWRQQMMKQLHYGEIPIHYRFITAKNKEQAITLAIAGAIVRYKKQYTNWRVIKAVRANEAFRIAERWTLIEGEPQQRLGNPTQLRLALWRKNKEEHIGDTSPPPEGL